MASPAEAHGPTYISSRSADVILSDIRPIKLNVEALRSINVLLDEFLYSVLHAAHSLTTHQLRSGLLKVLPTALGKEALLEAEMELRAYLERTATAGSSVAADEQGKDFHLQWCFELLRLKCQAYSTLSDSDEDAQAEARLIERMNHTASGVSPPKATLVAPAALYLTAILESVCEHVLSNVGRVAARDSSRTTATVQDLFVALCEDDSIYGLFKTMKVYEKIEDLSNIPKPRRSKSFSRPNGTASIGRTASPRGTESHPPSALAHTSSLPARSRLSSEPTGPIATSMLVTSSSTASRSSFEKARAIKMFSNNRSSSDHGINGSPSENQRSHKKNDSAISDTTKQTAATYHAGDSPTDDQEFDDMMRSGGTMRVSLTPDRLKSMEVYNKEKSQRGARKPVQKTDSRSSLKSNDIIPPTPELPRKAQQFAGSTVEDERSLGNKKPANRTRQKSLSSSTPPVTARLRTISASVRPGEQFSHTARKLSKTLALPSSPPTTYQSHERDMPLQQPNHTTYPPTRTHNVARNRESFDLDDVMGTSDDDEAPSQVVTKTPVQRPTQYPVSAGARDLIDFLAEGPPERPEESAFTGKDSQDTPKKGRLQRMISKLTLKDGEKYSRSGNGGNADSYSKSSRRTPSTAGSSATQSPMASPLYNKPVPPRPPPAPTSPPTTPSQSSTSLIEAIPPSPRTLRSSNSQRSVPSSWDPGSVPPSPRTPTPAAKGAPDLPTVPVAQASPKLPSVKGQAKSSYVKSNEAKEEEKPRTNIPRIPKQPPSSVNGTKVLLSPPERQSSKKSSDIGPKASDPDQSAAVAAFMQHVQEMRRLLAHATNVDECRLIVDMCVAKSGFKLEPTDYSKQSPPSTAPEPLLSAVDANLEHALVELFLGGAGEESEEDGDEQPQSPTNSASSKRGSVALPMSPPDTPDGNGSKATEPVVTDT